jgi:CheY-like chemotaxis protein
MKRLHLIHWNAEEAAELTERLIACGYQVQRELPGGSALVRQLGNNPPAAIVIDMSRLPSQGRDIALLLRKRKATRHVPLVFVGGDPEKVAQVRGLLPDAVYSSWRQIEDSLREAINRPTEDPVVPESQFAAYAGKPLSEKLGIKPDSAVGLVNAPDGFGGTLGELPDGARLCAAASEACALTIWFTRSGDELEREIANMAALAARGPLWIAWPKKASSVKTDLTQPRVRKVGLAAGLVDYKICSIDETWSGLLFTERRPRK